MIDKDDFLADVYFLELVVLVEKEAGFSWVLVDAIYRGRTRREGLVVVLMVAKWWVLLGFQEFVEYWISSLYDFAGFED